MSDLIKHAIVSGIILIFVFIFFLETLDMSNVAARLPQLIIGIITLLTIIMFIQSFIRKRKSTDTSEEEENDQINVKRVVLFALSIGLYIYLIDILGYFIVTPIFSFATLFYLTTLKITPLLVLSISFTFGVYLIFIMFLNIPLPMGLLS